VVKNKRDLEAAWIVEHIAGPLFGQKAVERVRRGDPLPTLPTVYFLLGADDTILYIGQTKFLANRIRTHERRLKNPIPFTTIEYFVPGIPILSDRLRLESALISIVVPPRNGAVLLKVCPKSRTLVEIRFGRRRRQKI